MLKPYFVVLENVMPKLWQMELQLWHMLCHLNFVYCCFSIMGGRYNSHCGRCLGHIVMNHVSRCYTKVEDVIAIITKGGVILNSEVLNKSTSQI